MQKLGGNPKETPQIATVIKNKNVMLEGQGEEGGEMIQKKLESKKIEMDEFEAFKKFIAMRKRQIERSDRRAKKGE